MCIGELERLRAKGADFVVLPSTMLWWLDYYQGYGEYLHTRHRALAREENTCAIFDLRAVEAGSPAQREPNRSVTRG